MLVSFSWQGYLDFSLFTVGFAEDAHARHSVQTSLTLPSAKRQMPNKKKHAPYYKYNNYPFTLIWRLA